MKVNIRPYKTHFNTYELEKFFEEKLKVPESITEKLGNFIQPILNFCWNDWEIRKRVNVKVHPYDAWNVDATLNPIIHPLLVELKNNKNGAPITDYKDAPLAFRPTKEELTKLKDWETDEKIFDRWYWILDEMIWTFKTLDSDWEDKFYSGETDFVWEPCKNEKLSKLKYGPKHTFTVDEEGYKKEYERIKNGLRLFGKYYLALWD